jgi:hypothetical protein
MDTALAITHPFCLLFAATDPALGDKPPTLGPSTAPIILQNAVVARALLLPRLPEMPPPPGQAQRVDAKGLDKLIKEWLEAYFEQQKKLTEAFAAGKRNQKASVEDAMPAELVWLLFQLLKLTARELKEVSRP